MQDGPTRTREPDLLLLATCCGQHRSIGDGGRRIFLGGFCYGLFYFRKKNISPKAGKPAKGKSGLASEATEDAVYRARSKFERWAECYSGLYEYQYRTLVETPDGDDDDPVFDEDEFALVPTRILYLYQTSIEEAREMLDHMEEQLHAALEAREAART